MSDITNIPQNNPEQQNQQPVQQNQNNPKQIPSYQSKQTSVPTQHTNVKAKQTPIQRTKNQSSIQTPPQLSPEAEEVRNKIPLPAYSGGNITKDEKKDPEKYRQRNFEYISTTMDRLVPYLKLMIEKGEKDKHLEGFRKINENLRPWHKKAQKKSGLTTFFTRNKKLIEKQEEVTQGVDKEIEEIKKAPVDDKGLGEAIKDEFGKLKTNKGHIDNSVNGLAQYNANQARQSYTGTYKKDKAGGQHSIDASLAELTMGSETALKYLHNQLIGSYKDEEAFIQIGRLLARPDVKQMAEAYQNTYGKALTKAITDKFGAASYDNKLGARSKYLLDMLDSPGKTPVSARLAISLGLMKRNKGFWSKFVSDEEEIVRLFETVNPKDLDKIWNEFRPLMYRSLNPHNYQRIKSFYHATRLYADNAKDDASVVKDGAKDFDDLEKTVAKKVYVNFFKKLGADDQKQVLEDAQNRLLYDNQALFKKEPLQGLPEDLKLTEIIGKLTVGDRATVKANIIAKLDEDNKKAMLKEEELTEEETLIETATTNWGELSEDDQKKKLEDQAIKEKWNSLGEDEKKKYAGEYDKNKSWNELSAEQKASYKAENPVVLPDKEQWKEQFLKHKKESLKNYQDKRTALANWQETTLENGLYLENKDRQLAAIVENLINGSSSYTGWFWFSPTVDGDAVIKAVDGWIKGATAEEATYFNGEPVIRRYVLGEKNSFLPLGKKAVISLENRNKYFLNMIDESTIRSFKLGWNKTHRNDMHASISRGLDERPPADNTSRAQTSPGGSNTNANAQGPTMGDVGRNIQIDTKKDLTDKKQRRAQAKELINQIQKVIRNRGKELEPEVLAALKMMAREAAIVDMPLTRSRKQDVLSSFGGLSPEAIMQLLNVFLSDTKETIEKSDNANGVETNVSTALANLRNALIVLEMNPKQIFEITGKLKYGTHVSATYLELRRYAGMDSDWSIMGREHFDGTKLLVLANKLSEKELAVAKSDTELHIGLERQFGKYYFSAWRSGRRKEGEKLFKQVCARLGFTPQNKWESKTRISKKDYQKLGKVTSTNKKKRELKTKDSDAIKKTEGSYIRYYWGLVKKDTNASDISSIEAEITKLKDQDKTVEIEALKERIKQNKEKSAELDQLDKINEQKGEKKKDDEGISTHQKEQQAFKDQRKQLEVENATLQHQMANVQDNRGFVRKMVDKLMGQNSNPNYIKLQNKSTQNNQGIQGLLDQEASHQKKIEALQKASNEKEIKIKSLEQLQAKNQAEIDRLTKEVADIQVRLGGLENKQKANEKRIAKLTSDKEKLDQQEKTRNEEVDKKQNGLKKQDAGFNNLKEIKTVNEGEYKTKVEEWAARWSETIANTGEERKMLHMAMLVWQAGDAVVTDKKIDGNPYARDLTANRRNIFLYEVYKVLEANHPKEAKKLAADTTDMTTGATVAGVVTVPVVVGGLYLGNKGIRHLKDRNMHFVEKLKAGSVDVIDEILRSNYRTWRPSNNKDQVFVKQSFDKLSGRVLLDTWTDVAGHEAILKERKQKKEELDKASKTGRDVTQLKAAYDALNQEIRHHRIPLPSPQRLEQLKKTFTNDKVYLDTVEALFTRLAKAAKDEVSFAQAMEEKGYLPSDLMILGETYEALATQEREKFMSGGKWTPQWGLFTAKGMERQEANVELVSKFRNLSAANDQGKTREEMTEQIDAFGAIKGEVTTRTENFIKAAETYRANIKTFITLLVSVAAVPFASGAIGAWWATALLKAILATTTTFIDQALSHEQPGWGRIIGESIGAGLKHALGSVAFFAVNGVSDLNYGGLKGLLKEWLGFEDIDTITKNFDALAQDEDLDAYIDNQDKLAQLEQISNPTQDDLDKIQGLRAEIDDYQSKVPSIKEYKELELKQSQGINLTTDEQNRLTELKTDKDVLYMNNKEIEIQGGTLTTTQQEQIASFEKTKLETYYDNKDRLEVLNAKGNLTDEEKIEQAKLTKKVKSFDDAISNLQKHGKLDETWSKEYDKIKGLEKDNVDLGSDLKDQETEHTSLKGQLTTQETEHTSLKGQLTTQETQHTKLQEQLKNATDPKEQTRLKGLITDNKQEQSRLKDLITDNEQEQTRLKGSITTNEQEQTRLKGLITTNEQSITSTRQGLDFEAKDDLVYGMKKHNLSDEQRALNMVKEMGVNIGRTAVTGVAGQVTNAIEKAYREGSLKEGMKSLDDGLFSRVFPAGLLKGAMITAFLSDYGTDFIDKFNEVFKAPKHEAKSLNNPTYEQWKDENDRVEALNKEEKTRYGGIAFGLRSEMTSRMQEFTQINYAMAQLAEVVKSKRTDFKDSPLKGGKTTHLDDMKALQATLDKIGLLLLGEDVKSIETTIEKVRGFQKGGELVTRLKSFVKFIGENYPKDKADLLSILKERTKFDEIQAMAKKIETYMLDPENKKLKPEEENQDEPSNQSSLPSSSLSNLSSSQSNLSNSQSNPPNPVKQLPIQVQTQINPKSCWAACLSMLLGKYGINKTQQDLIGSFTDGANGLDLGAMHDEWGNQTFNGNLTPDLLREFGNPKKAHISFNDIKQSIDAGNPILIGVQNNEYKAHALIITGYDESNNNVYFIDPYVQGTVKTVAYTDLAGTGIDLLLGKQFLWVETLKFTVPNP